MSDYAVGDTINIKFTTRAFATGIPTALLGTPTIHVFEDDNATAITAGQILTPNFSSVIGLNNARIVATGANGFEAGKNYDVVILTGTVDGVSVVGEVVGSFSLDKAPVGATAAEVWANAGRTLTSAANITSDASAITMSAAGVVGFVNVCITNNDMLTTVDVWVNAATRELTSASKITSDASAITMTSAGVLGTVTDLTNLPAAPVDWLTAAAIQLDAIGASEFAASAAQKIRDEILSDSTPFKGSIIVRMEEPVDAVVLGTSAAGATLNNIPTSALDPGASAVDQFKGRILTFTSRVGNSANLMGQTVEITGNSTGGATASITVTPLSHAPVSGDTFTIQ